MATNLETTTTPDARPPAEQPRWRQDFPIDWPQDHFVSRRDFTKFMVLTSFAFVVGQLWILARSLLRRRQSGSQIMLVTRVDQIPLGGSFAFSYPAANDPCLLLRPDEKSLVAFSQKCTHLSCAVVPQPERNCFHCPCHEGFFDLKSGNPIAGPPRRPLPRIKLEVRGGVIYATGVEERTL